MTSVIRASETVARALSPGAIVVYESTVYPGATEEECVPVLEGASGLVCGKDFTVGYSPERINPGDPIHRFDRVTKVVAAQDEKTLDVVADVYGSVVTRGVYRAPSIKVAEAAKVLENTQRDLNIALMNEFALICRRIGIDTADVIDAARTKWNFQPFTPGLVGGHCIGVDPYYLAHKATMCGYLPEMILAGRRINDRMSDFVAQECIRLLASRGVCQAHVVVLGITFKENVRDIRNSKTVDIIRQLDSHGYKVSVHDPLSDPVEVNATYGVELKRLRDIAPADAVIVTVPHNQFVTGGWKLVQRCLKGGKGIVLDVRSCLERTSLPDGIELWRM
jgi:UDP-N-acetyl-D-glucosamine/UDP-N-acetyl-D-galactosamine dehydrogenase